MQDKYHYDVFIIGAGQAGIPLAYDLANAGMQVGIAERDHLGGSCVNFGCTPSKAAFASAKLVHTAQRAEEFGVRIPKVSSVLSAVLSQANNIAMQSRKSLQEGLETSENPRLLRETAYLEGREDGKFNLHAGNKTVSAKHIVLNTGSQNVVPPIEGLKDIDYIHSENWLDKTDLPEHLVIIGGGAIGIEMAQFYRRMGSLVTVIDHAKQILPMEDEDVSGAVQKILAGETIKFRLNTQVKRILSNGNGTLTLTLEGAAVDQINASHIFIATGRKPNTDGLGLEKIGVNILKSGAVETNERCSSNIDGIWAAGDVRGEPMFTHNAYHDYRVIASQLTGKKNYRANIAVPYAIFTDPELGRIGLTEKQAKENGEPVVVSRFDMKNNGKAGEIRETNGFIKIIVHKETKRILGASVLAAGGAELVHNFINIMNADADYTTIRDAVYIHPTLSEAVQSVITGID